MCGLFGFVATPGQQVDPQRLEKVACVTERRGPHSFGFAWIDARGRLKMFKRAGRISDYLGALSMAADARVLIGHCRFATHGSPENNLNNHPHPCDGGWLVHNGVISGHREINEGYLLSPVTQCDSETLALLIEQMDGTVIRRVGKAALECATAPLATMCLWRNPQRMIAVRANDQPLHLGSNQQGIYLGSLAGGIPNAKKLTDNSGVSFTVRERRIHLKRFTLKSIDVLS